MNGGNNLSAYQLYRDLALLYVIFFLSDKKIKSISIDTVQRKFLEFFPEESNFPDLLQRAEKMGSVILGIGVLTLTETGAESANKLGDPIKRKIDKQTYIDAEFVEVKES